MLCLLPNSSTSLIFMFLGAMQHVASIWPRELHDVSTLPILLALAAAILLGGLLAFKSLAPGIQKDLQQDRLQKKKSYTAEEVAEHTGKDSLWIILKDKVYNVTPYIEEHPGGDAIFRNAGGDSTAGFFAPQHPERVFDLIDDFYIGDLAD